MILVKNSKNRGETSRQFLNDQSKIDKNGPFLSILEVIFGWFGSKSSLVGGRPRANFWNFSDFWTKIEQFWSKIVFGGGETSRQFLNDFGVFHWFSISIPNFSAWNHSCEFGKFDMKQPPKWTFGPFWWHFMAQDMGLYISCDFISKNMFFVKSWPCSSQTMRFWFLMMCFAKTHHQKSLIAC